jgi:hypothetical protein
MFHVGQRVVCVANVIEDTDDYAQGETVPVVGQVYTIRSIEDYPDGPSATLEEIVNRPLEYELFDGSCDVGECDFPIYNFRPVKTTNIDVFLKMLEPVDA